MRRLLVVGLVLAGCASSGPARLHPGANDLPPVPLAPMPTATTTISEPPLHIDVETDAGRSESTTIPVTLAVETSTTFERPLTVGTPLVTAERADPPTTPAPSAPPPIVHGVDGTTIAGRCTQWEPLLHRFNPGWSVERMSRIMWRESRCDMTVRSTTQDTCGLQINDINHVYLRRELGEWVDRWTLAASPTQCVRAAAALFRYWGGYQAWSTS